jgi:hypothetical protein
MQGTAVEIKAKALTDGEDCHRNDHTRLATAIIRQTCE